MVTPHAAYATSCAKKTPPHATSATAVTAAAAGTASGDGPAPRCHPAPQATNSVSEADNQTAPQQAPPSPPVTVAAITPATSSAGNAFGRVHDGGGCGIDGASDSVGRGRGVLLDGSSGGAFAAVGGGAIAGGGRAESEAPSLSQGATTTCSVSENGNDLGKVAPAVAPAAAAALMTESTGTRGVGVLEGAGSETQQQQVVDESVRRRVRGEGEEERHGGRRVVSGDAEEVCGGPGNANNHELRRALPGDGGGGGGRGRREEVPAGRGEVAGLGKLEKSPPALYEDVIDKEVEEEDDDGDDDGGDDSYEVWACAGKRYATWCFRGMEVPKSRSGVFFFLRARVLKQNQRSATCVVTAAVAVGE